MESGETAILKLFQDPRGHSGPQMGLRIPPGLPQGAVCLQGGDARQRPHASDLRVQSWGFLLPYSGEGGAHGWGLRFFCLFFVFVFFWLF